MLYTLMLIIRYLDSSLGQASPLRKLLSGLQIRVVALLELLLKLFQLVGRKAGPAPAELRPVVVGVNAAAGVGLRVEVDGPSGTHGARVRRGQAGRGLSPRGRRREAERNGVRAERRREAGRGRGGRQMAQQGGRVSVPGRRQVGVRAGWRSVGLGSRGAAVDAVLVVDAGGTRVLGGGSLGRAVAEDPVDAGHAGGGAVGADGCKEG